MLYLLFYSIFFFFSVFSFSLTLDLSIILLYSNLSLVLTPCFFMNLVTNVTKKKKKLSSDCRTLKVVSSGHVAIIKQKNLLCLLVNVTRTWNLSSLQQWTPFNYNIGSDHNKNKLKESTSQVVHIQIECVASYEWTNLTFVPDHLHNPRLISRLDLCLPHEVKFLIKRMFWPILLMDFFSKWDFISAT